MTLGEHETSVMLQVCDTAFPSGSLANSLGLESAVAHGFVTRGEDGSLLQFSNWSKMTLEQLTHQALPFVRASHAACMLRDEDGGDKSGAFIACLHEVEQICCAVTINDVAKRSSLSQGRCFLRAASAAFSHRPGSGALEGMAAAVTLGHLQGHYSIIFGAVCGVLGVSVATAERMMLRCALRDLASAAARLNILGPLEGAGLQARLGETVVEPLLASSPSAISSSSSSQQPINSYSSLAAAHSRLHSRSKFVVTASAAGASAGAAAGAAGAAPSALLSKEIVHRLLNDDVPTVTAPVLELVQGRHDLLYARLFNS